MDCPSQFCCYILNHFMNTFKILQYLGTFDISTKEIRGSAFQKPDFHTCTLFDIVIIKTLSSQHIILRIPRIRGDPLHFRLGGRGYHRAILSEWREKERNPHKTE